MKHDSSTSTAAAEMFPPVAYKVPSLTYSPSVTIFPLQLASKIERRPLSHGAVQRIFDMVQHYLSSFRRHSQDDTLLSTLQLN